MSDMTCAVLGSGNIGTDLMYKLLRSQQLQLTAVVDIDPDSDGLTRARNCSLDTPAEGADWILGNPEQCRFVFDATSASAHRAHAPAFEEAGLQTIDLTPAKLGPAVVPDVNLDRHWAAPDVNMNTCGGQATIPIAPPAGRRPRRAPARLRRRFLLVPPARRTRGRPLRRLGLESRHTPGLRPGLSPALNVTIQGIRATAP